MTQESLLLISTAASVALIHTLLGPDHYVPFIVLSRARGWSQWKTILITGICGLGHVAGSILIGFIGIALGTFVNRLIDIESARGTIAAWMMIAFGLAYLVYGIRHSVKQKKHSHLHFHTDGTKHVHQHNHEVGHSHFHEKKSYRELTPWILFTIFVFGPCEPFIPILLYPAAMNNMALAIAVTLTFSIITVATMITIVLVSSYGFKLLPQFHVEKYMHAIAGASILMCGIAIQFIGL